MHIIANSDCSAHSTPNYTQRESKYLKNNKMEIKLIKIHVKTLHTQEMFMSSEFFV